MTSVLTPPTRRPGRPARISRDQIVAKAIELADAHGLDAVGIRELARHLGVTPVALYRHVGNKDEVIDLVVGALVEQHSQTIPWPQDPSDWRGSLRALATSFRSVLLEHPLILEVCQRRASTAPRSAQTVDRCLRALRAAGLSDDDTVEAYVAVNAFVIGFTSLEHGRAHTCAARGLSTAEERKRLAGVYRQKLAGTETIQSLAEQVASITDGGRFQGALAHVLNGIAVAVDKANSAAPGCTA
jgi:AcrR family transcriptional regulator